jgi:photosystem II stability/assembly factor-like uncharacterized protein
LGSLPYAIADEKDNEPEPNKGGPPEFKFIKYRSVGPAAGGRVARSTGVPGDPLTYYAATAAGGVWKSSDAGLTWKPIFDEQPISSIGSIAVAPSDPNVVYVGSGEANIRGNVASGNGIYKSTDAGKTWAHVWKQEGQIGKIIVHPTSPDVAFAAVLGHAFGPNPERGIYRTTDGGKVWNKVLFKNADTGASAVSMDPNNPRIIFAGLWQTRRRPWELTSGGPGSGLYVSRDGGDTWKQLTEKGLPAGIWGKIDVAVAASDSRRVYALIEADQGGLFRSEDGGEKWDRINGSHYLRIRPWYFNTFTIDPRNADVIYCASLRLLKSIDGGKSFKQVLHLHHVDHHDIWIDPKNPARMIDSNDGGVDITTNSGETWYAPPLPIAQFYHVSADNRKPYHVAGTMQDLGTASGPSNSLSAGGIQICDWITVGGGETGFTVPDPADPFVIYAGEYGGYISRFDFRTRQARNVSIYPYQSSGHGDEDLRYRFQWTAPIIISPHDSKTIYHGANVLLRSNDAGLHWSAISHDLTTNDRTKQKWSGGPITGDNTGAEYYCTIFAIAESPKQKGVLWTGSDDGLVHISQDGGQNWTNVTKNITGIPQWGTVDCIEPSHFDVATAYIVVDAHRLDDMRPYLFKTTDFGKTWEKLSGRLPQDIYLHAVREDPQQKGMLYAATERGVIFSRDDGVNWYELKLNLPTVAVHDLVVKDNDLVLATTGRSIWILDDLTPIREFTAKVKDEATHLFPIQSTIRWRYHGPFDSRQKPTGDNPPEGAIIDYYLSKKPKESIKIEITTEEGIAVKELSSNPEPEEATEDDPDAPEEKPKKALLTKELGVNRVVWDLRYQGATKIPKAKSEGDPKIGPLVFPGTYRVTLKVEDKTVTTPLIVQPDPRIKDSPDILAEQLKFALALRGDINEVSDMVSRLRTVRSQLTARNGLLKENTGAKEKLDPSPITASPHSSLMKSSEELISKIDALEGKLHNPKAEVFYDILAQKGGAQLYSKLIGLYAYTTDSDGSLTQGIQEVYQEQKSELDQDSAAFRGLLEEVAKLNDEAKKLNLPGIIVPAAKKSAK